MDHKVGGNAVTVAPCVAVATGGAEQEAAALLQERFASSFDVAVHLAIPGSDG